ncbi:hypothetical protein ACMGDM_16740 [Sphingomonas sp. DT-51]|uniref:hypothetical protein n=1 Tax=Sphingomonas sp. DT-51 TaxID=3396165 RepID=UPI003F1B456E
MIQSVKLSKLVLPDVNVRKRRADKAESFAISIAANGILQNLIARRQLQVGRRARVHPHA